MPFSLFTRRTNEPSTRLRAIARLFQVAGVLGLVTLAFSLNLFLKPEGPFAHNPGVRANFLSFMPKYILFTIVRSIAYYLIGRSLIRRQQWGAILAAVTVFSSVVYQLKSPYSSLPPLILSVVGLTLIVSIWPELTSVPDNGEVDTDPPPKPSTLRSGGFGSYTRKLRDTVSLKSPNREQALNTAPISPTDAPPRSTAPSKQQT